MRSLLLVAHGSLQAGADFSLEAHAGRLRGLGKWERVDVCFLNYGMPTIQDAMEALGAADTEEAVIVPYFLTPGRFVLTEIPRQIALASRGASRPRLRLGNPIGYDASLAAMLAELAEQALSGSKASNAPRCAAWILLAAHGSPEPGANEPVYRVAADLLAAGEFGGVGAAFLECNAPTILDEAARMASEGARRVVILPFFLHQGRHVSEDLPAVVRPLRETFPATEFQLASCLGDHAGISEIVARRADQAAEYAASEEPAPVPGIAWYSRKRA